MSLGEWLNNLSTFDHLVLIVLLLIGTYLSKISLNTFIKYYEQKTNYSKYRIQLRITPFMLLSIGLIYTYIIYQILDEFLTFIP